MYAVKCCELWRTEATILNGTLAAAIMGDSKLIGVGEPCCSTTRISSRKGSISQVMVPSTTLAWLWLRCLKIGCSRLKRVQSIASATRPKGASHRIFPASFCQYTFRIWIHWSGDKFSMLFRTINIAFQISTSASAPLSVCRSSWKLSLGRGRF